ncbi:MAG: membrane protein insertion efficiency factor YidD [Alphaproteobacteria bacterium]|nr:membrane protein insertion efficiency factor YidD [Alphaproteobacteria bacterium]
MKATDPLVWTIRGYQKLISPLTPPMCRFTPTCSQYAVEALQVHGLVRGSALAAWRIARCQPLSAGGHDPVPPPHGALATDDGATDG